MDHPSLAFKRPAKIRFANWAMLSLLVLAGCSPPTGDRVPLAGEVTLDGQPLDRGSIEFHPDGEGTITGGMIRDGKFEIPVNQGVKPGKYLVRIFASGEAIENDPVEPPGPEAETQVSEERIPAKYNTETELTADIGDQGADTLRFEVETS